MAASTYMTPLMQQDPNEPDFLASILGATPLPQQPVSPLQSVMYPEDQIPMTQRLQQLTQPAIAVIQPPPKQLISRGMDAELNKRSTSGLDIQRSGLKELQDQIKQYESSKSGIDPIVAALMGASDIIGGTNFIQQNVLPQKQAEEEKRQRVLAMKAQALGLANQITDKEIALRKDQFQNAKEAQRFALEEEKVNRMLDLQEQKLNQKGAGLDLTPGEKSNDVSFGKDYEKWIQERPTLQQNLDLMKEARDNLKANPEYVGGISASLPDPVRARISPEALANQQKVQQAVQATLKSTLGAQFTAKEGEQLLNRSYDPRLSAEQNIEKLDSAIATIEAKMNGFDEKAALHDKYGTTSKRAIKKLDPTFSDSKAAVPSFEEWKKAKGHN